MTVLDTSYLVALVDAHDPHHKAAKMRALQAPLHVVRTDLAECATLLRRRARERGHDANETARVALHAIATMPGFHEPAAPPLERVLELYRAHHRLSFYDACTLAAALDLNEPLASFDTELVRVHKRLART